MFQFSYLLICDFLIFEEPNYAKVKSCVLLLTELEISDSYLLSS